MNQETKTLVTYRLERAHESLDEANILLERGHANTFVNRLYYACFYAVRSIISFVSPYDRRRHVLR